MRRVLAALAVTIALGLLSRLRPIGWSVYDKSLGDVLYAVAIYLVLALLWLGRPWAFVASATLAICLAVELFKLTGIPEQYANLAAVRWTLGTIFSWHNLACYVIGVALAAALDVSLLRPHLLERERPAQA